MQVHQDYTILITMTDTEEYNVITVKSGYGLFRFYSFTES